MPAGAHGYCYTKLLQESRAVARKPRDAAVVVFGLKLADNIHYKFTSPSWKAMRASRGKNYVRCARNLSLKSETALCTTNSVNYSNAEYNMHKIRT